MKKFKKLTATVVSLMMVCTSMGGFTLLSSADMIANDDGFTITLSKNDTLSFSADKSGKPTVTYKGSTKVYTGKIILEGTLENGFTVEKGIHNIILNGVTINDSIAINPSARANIAVEGKENTVTAKVKKGLIDDTGKAGINVPEGATLNLSGNGTLTAKGSDDDCSILGDGGAGVGGNDEENAGEINISGNVTVNAQGGFNAAGIGGGENGDGGNISISGGTVNTTSKKHGAGIGGGFLGDSGDIAIKNAVVTATGGEYAAGIGGGDGFLGVDGECENITIDNSEVTAAAGLDAEPIGGGCTEFNSGKVSINGKELDKATRKTYKNWSSIKVNYEGNVEQYYVIILFV